MRLPDPFTQISLLSLRSLRGANFWARFPVTRLDLAIGDYDDISSADVLGFTDFMLESFPGLVEHHCSLGARGGFVTRLRRGTYVPHIVEHVALELQTLIGHEVSFGRARGGDRPGEYTVVFAHRHVGVGECAARLGLDRVQRAIGGRSLCVEEAVSELRCIASLPEEPPSSRTVLCGITGAGPRREVRDALANQWTGAGDIVDLPPARLLAEGLPYASSRLAVVLGSELTDVTNRFREPAAATQLLSVVADAVAPDGFVVVPATERELQHRIRQAGCRLATFQDDGPVSSAEPQCADVSARLAGGRVVIASGGRIHTVEPMSADAEATVPLVAALCRFLLDMTSAANP